MGRGSPSPGLGRARPVFPSPRRFSRRPGGTPVPGWPVYPRDAWHEFAAYRSLARIGRETRFRKRVFLEPWDAIRDSSSASRDGSGIPFRGDCAAVLESVVIPSDLQWRLSRGLSAGHRICLAPPTSQLGADALEAP